MDDVSIWRQLTDSLPVFVCLADPATHIPVYCNDAANEIMPKSEKDRKSLITELLAQPVLIKFFAYQNDGKWFKLSHTKCKWKDGKIMALISGTDYSDSVNLSEVLATTDYTDKLTGLYNRHTALNLLARHIRERELCSFTVCYIDLDGLRDVNEKAGYNEGDRYILTVVDILRRAIRQTDIFTRIGGDEFFLIFPKCKTAVIENIMEMVEHKLSLVNNNNDPKTAYGVSYGIMEVNVDEPVHSETPFMDAGMILTKLEKMSLAMKKEKRQ
jgi:diguanylate cyclase (GGDEF)-like protein